MKWSKAQRAAWRAQQPSLEELRAKALFFGVHAVRSNMGINMGHKDPMPWCVEYIDDPASGIAMRGKWHRTEYQALEECLDYMKIHGYPDR